MQPERKWKSFILTHQCSFTISVPFIGATWDVAYSSKCIIYWGLYTVVLWSGLRHLQRFTEEQEGGQPTSLIFKQRDLQHFMWNASYTFFGISHLVLWKSLVERDNFTCALLNKTGLLPQMLAFSDYRDVQVCLSKRDKVDICVCVVSFSPRGLPHCILWYSSHTCVIARPIQAWLSHLLTEI